MQSIAAQLAREQFNIRLQTKVLDGGPPAAAAAIDNGQADLAVVRRDVGMPKNGQAVAILRKNVVVFIVPSAAEPPRLPKERLRKGQDRRQGQGCAKAKPCRQGQGCEGQGRRRRETEEAEDPARSRKSIRWSASGSA